MPLVQSIVEKHQGRTWVRSQLGQECTFTFVLPILVAQEGLPARLLPAGESVAAWWVSRTTAASVTIEPDK